MGAVETTSDKMRQLAERAEIIHTEIVAAGAVMVGPTEPNRNLSAEDQSEQQSITGELLTLLGLTRTASPPPQ